MILLLYHRSGAAPHPPDARPSGTPDPPEAEDLDPTLRPVRSFDVHWRAIDEGGAILHPEDGRNWTLDPVGLLIWDRCTGEWNVEQIAREISESYDVDPGTARSDLEAFLLALEQAGLVRLFVPRAS